MKPKKKIAIAFFLSSAISTTAFAALYGFGPAEGWTIQQITQLTTNIVAKIGAFGSSFATQLQTKNEQVISAIAVATKQEAMSANVVSDTIRQSHQQYTNAIVAQQRSDQVASNVMKYSPLTGQGYDPCGTNAKNKTLDVAFASKPVFAKAKVSSLDTAPGKMVPSVKDAMGARLETHRDKFCTEAEDHAGLCTVSALPGGDTNAALLFESAPSGSLISDARSAYMQHVLGQPDQLLPGGVGGTVAGETFQLQKNKKDTLLSIPAYSLAMIDAANTQQDNLGGKSPNEVLSLRINQYFGGKEAEAWSGAMARQDTRGLLVETAKMQGLEIWLRNERYKQNQRLEANFAALVVSKSSQFSANLDNEYQKVIKNAAARQVK